MMRAMLLVALSMLPLLPMGGVLAERAKIEVAAGAESKKEISGTVEEFDTASGRVVVDGQDYFIPPSADGLSPQAGDRITLTYEEQGGRRVVTSVGQGQ